MIYITIHDDDIEGTLKDLSVAVAPSDSRSDTSHRVQEKTNELLTSWNIVRDEVMPDE